MPVGTIISDADSGERIAELLAPEERVLLAKGGDGGFGNLHFKSSTNRAPRQKTPGWPGEAAAAEARASRARRRRPARHAERRQVDPDRGDLERAAEDRRLPVHDAASESRRGARRAGAELRRRRHSRPDRGRRRRRRARPPVPAPSPAHAPAAASGRLRAVRRERRSGCAGARDRRRARRSTTRRSPPSRAGWCSTRST